MIKKYLVLTLAALVVNLWLGASAFAVTNTSEKAAKYAEKVKVGIAKLGTGPDARVEVKLNDGTKVKGYVSRVGETSFDVTDPKTGTTTEVPYPNAKQVKGNNLSDKAKIIIGTALIAATVLVLVLAYRSGE